MRFKEGLYRYMEEDLAGLGFLDKLQAQRLKMWVDTALAEAEAKNSFAMEKLTAYADDIARNYDCDEDSHRHGTSCRVCDAKEVLSLIAEGR